MGLKYHVFMLNQPIEDFHNQLLKGGCYDETEIFLKDREFNAKQLDDLQNIHKLPEEKQYEEWKKISRRKPKDKDLLEYQKRQNDEKITEICIWFMPVPSDKNFTFGMCTYIPIFVDKFKAVLAAIFHKANIYEWIFISYHHTSNDGNVLLIKATKDDFDVDKFPYIEGEREHYDDYAERIKKKIGYPIPDLHDYFCNIGYNPLQWKYQVTFKLNTTSGEMRQNEYPKSVR